MDNKYLMIQAHLGFEQMQMKIISSYHFVPILLEKINLGDPELQHEIST